MDPIRTDVSEAALVTAIRANMCDFFRCLARSDPAKHHETDRFTRWASPLPHPWFNGVLCSKLPNEADVNFIDETVQYFRTKKVRTFTWWMEPHLNPLEWEPVLSKRGFGFSDDTPGMAIDLQELEASRPAIEGLEIRRVEAEEALRAWAATFVNGYGLPADWELPTLQLWKQLGLDLPMRNYLGYWNGKPVATSSLFLGGGAAGVYCVATLPEARGRGLGAALTLQPLLEARELGYRIGVLQSSKMGFKLYKTLGFRHLCQIENFYLPAR